ncbi:MAG: SoxR reducing system RseC family protein [Candidatus Aminicenantes bacterium]
MISTRGDMAEVEVSCLDGCHDCSARNLCGVGEDKKGSLKVLNPVGAAAGDKVGIDIPETAYSRNLILLFGGLLSGAVAGAFAGYLLTPLTALTSDITSLLGLFAGGGAAGWMLFRRLRRNSHRLYPVITGVIPQKGESNG